jgi:hypothetical protein
MEPGQLTVYKSPHQKERIGKDPNNGHVICDIPGIIYDVLLCGGYTGNSSFEEAFIQKYKGCITYVIDGTTLPAFLENTISIKKNIGYYENDRETNLHRILNSSYNNFFIKVDANGAEFPWIKSLTAPHLNKISQMVVKFNYPFSDYDVFDALKHTHTLVHFCPVETAGNRKHKGVMIPNVFVCTYIHNKHYNSIPELNTDPIPASIDNNKIDRINHPPFVNVVTNPTKSTDGFGENFKLLIYSVMFAELHGCKFLYTPFKQMEHNYDMDPEYLAKKEHLINFIGNFEQVPNEDDTNQQKPYVLDTFELLRFYQTNIVQCAESKSLDRIKDLFRANKTDPFDKSYMNVAIHIRRMNKEDYKRTNNPNVCLMGMDVPDDLYLTSISQVEQISGDRPVRIHIFSQGKPEDFEIYLKNNNNVVLHLNEDLESTFTQMVYADVLLTAPSALSYSAALISRGIVFYIEFCNPKLPKWNTVVGYKSTRMKHEFVVPLMTTIYYDPYTDKIEKA